MFPWILCCILLIVVFFLITKIIFIEKNFDYPEKTLKYKHIRRISD